MEIIALLKGLALITADWVRAHVFKIATAFTTALLVIYGDRINAAVKRRIRPYPFVIRTLIFVLLHSFGYGMLTVLITPSVAQFLRYPGDQYVAIFVLSPFLTIGVLAERKKYL